MTVKELIEHLAKLDPNTRVFTSGVEGGFCDPKISDVESFVLNHNNYIFFGPHAKLFESNVKQGDHIVRGISLK